MAHPVHSYRVGDEPVPGYRLVSFLGRGGFGEVWKASAPGKTEAALKMIDLRGQQGLKEFESLRLVKRIHHPNLIPVQAFWLKNEDGEIIDEAEAGWADATLPGATQVVAEVKPADSDGSTSLLIKPVELVIAMGLGHKNLFGRLREAQNEGETGIPLDELLDYMDGAAQGIDYLNTSIQIIHGDIKPHNILVVGNAAAVCDFGLARAVENLRKTATTSVTVAYAAPEALRGKPNLRSDQYSLAITYVELRTGSLPFDDSLSCFELMSAHVNGSLNLSKLPKAELEVIQRAACKDSEGRWPSNRDMVKALRRAAEKPARKGFFSSLFGGDRNESPGTPGSSSKASGPLDRGAGRGTDRGDSAGSISKTAHPHARSTGFDQTQELGNLSTPPSDITMPVPESRNYRTTPAPAHDQPAHVVTERYIDKTPVFAAPPLGSGPLSPTRTGQFPTGAESSSRRRRRLAVKLSIGLSITLALLAAAYLTLPSIIKAPPGSFMERFDGCLGRGEYAAATDLLDKEGELELSAERRGREREDIRSKWNDQGQTDFKAGRWDVAKKHAEELLARFPGDSQATVLLARVNIQQHIDLAQFAAAFDQLIDPAVVDRIVDGVEKKLTILESWRRLVERLHREERIADAQQQLNALRQRYPEDGRSKALDALLTVQTHTEATRFVEAYETLQSGDAALLKDAEKIDLRDRLLERWLERADAEFKTGNKTKAEEICDSINHRFPGDVNARALLAAIRGEAPPVTPDELLATIDDLTKRKKFVEAYDKLTSAPKGLLTVEQQSRLRTTIQKDWIALAQEEAKQGRMILAQVLCSDILERFPGDKQALVLESQIKINKDAMAAVAVIKSIKEDEKSARYGVALEALDKHRDLLKTQAEITDKIRAEIRVKWLAKARDEFRVAPQEAKALGTCREVLARYEGDPEALLLEARFLGRLDSAEQAKAKLRTADISKLPEELTPLRRAMELLYDPASDEAALLVQMQRADERPVPRESPFALDDGERDAIRALRSRALKEAQARMKVLAETDAKSAISLGSRLLKLSLESADSIYDISLALVKLHFDEGQFAESREALAAAVRAVKSDDVIRAGATLDWKCRIALNDAKSAPEDVDVALTDAGQLVSGEVDGLPAIHQHLCQAVAEYSQMHPERLERAIAILKLAADKSPTNPEIAGLLGGLVERRVELVLTDAAASQDELQAALQDASRLLHVPVDPPSDRSKKLSKAVLDLVNRRTDCLATALKALKADHKVGINKPVTHGLTLLGELLVLHLPGELGREAPPDWKALTKDCELVQQVGKSNALIEAIRQECQLESNSGAATGPASPAIQPTTPYMHYVHARSLGARPTVPWEDVAKSLQAAYPATLPTEERPVELKAPYRRQRGARLLMQFAAQKRPPLDDADPSRLFKPFASPQEADGAFQSLTAAARLSEDLPASFRLTDKELAAIHNDRLLAAWYKTTPETALVANFTAGSEPLDLPLLIVQFQAQKDAATRQQASLRACSRLLQAFQQQYPYAEVEAGTLYDRVVLPAESVAAAYEKQSEPETKAELAKKLELAVFYGEVGDFVAKYRHADWPFKDRHQKIVNLFDLAIKLKGDDADYLIARGIAKADMAEPDVKGGLEDVEKAMNLKPDLAAGYDLRGQLMLVRSRQQTDLTERVKDLSLSIEDCTKAIGMFQTPIVGRKVEDRLPTCLIHLSQAYLERANYSGRLAPEQIQADLQKAVDCGQTATGETQRYPAYAWWVLGNALEDVAWLAGVKPEENYSRAIDAFSEAIAKRETQPQLWVNRGRCFYKAVAYGKLGTADLQVNRDPLELSVEDLGRACELNPESADAHLWLGRTHAYRRLLVEGEEAGKRFALADKAFELAKTLELKKPRPELVYALDWAGNAYLNPAWLPPQQIAEVRRRAEIIKAWPSYPGMSMEPAKEAAILIALSHGKYSTDASKAADNAAALAALNGVTVDEPLTASDRNLLLTSLRLRSQTATNFRDLTYYQSFVDDAKRLAEIAKDAPSLAEEHRLRSEGHKLAAQARFGRRKFASDPPAVQLVLRDETIVELSAAILLVPERPDTWELQEPLAALLKLKIDPETNLVKIKSMAVEAKKHLAAAIASTTAQKLDVVTKRLKDSERELNEMLTKKKVTLP